MSRFVMRVLGPFGRAVRSRFDGRYVTRDDHRRDIRDTLREVQMLRREIAALRGELDRLRESKADPRVAEAHRLATETAEALDQVLRNEVRLWQAVDELSVRTAG